ncbi:hypothetical protein ACTFSP_26430 [Bacillus cereus group sp. MYBK108-2]|uniref:hypothetical protein n=1 Tax=Bacillus cereus group TaxID=86661 RepID=UPI000B4B9EB1|nr:hypothetical protein [Bacillus cereus]HEF1899756.1 hypothetical protein [Bacillus cereus]
MLKKKKYEIKFFLDIHRVLNEKYKLKPEIIDEFSIDIKDIDEKTIQFIDTNKRELYKNGWILRNRIKRENSTYELTYKKRYKILNNNIEAEVEIAKKAGFGTDEQEFQVEIDWGYTEKVLNIVYKPEEFQLPNSEASSVEILQELFLKNGPEIFLKWGKELIEQTINYGPVYSQKYTGNFKEREIFIEIWSMPECKEPILEISLEKFKDEEKDKADQYHDELKELLNNKEWIITRDFSKTDWVMNKCE